jgi:hypothetical protein
MLVVETIARIRREHFIKGKTIKEKGRCGNEDRLSRTKYCYPSIGRWRAAHRGTRRACTGI